MKKILLFCLWAIISSVHTSHANPQTPPTITKYPLVNEHNILDNYAYLETQPAYAAPLFKDETAYANSLIDSDFVQSLQEQIGTANAMDNTRYWLDNGVIIAKENNQYRHTLGKNWQTLATKDKANPPKFSPNTHHYANTYDEDGDENYTLAIHKTTAQNSTPIHTIPNTGTDFVWLDDDTLIYANRFLTQIRQYRLSDKSDTPLYTAPLGFFVGVSDSTSKDYVIISTNNDTTSQTHLIDKQSPDTLMSLDVTEGQEYYLDHANGQFVIKSNHATPNFGLYTAKFDALKSRDNWQTLFLPSDDETLESFMSQGLWHIIKTRKQGQTQLYYQHLTKQQATAIKPFDETYKIWLESGGFDPEHPDFKDNPSHTLNANLLGVGYSSPTTPTQRLIFDLEKGDWRYPPKQKNTAHTVKRLWATAKDGTQIPISVIYRPDRFIHGKNPLIVTGYGAYGHSMDTTYGTSYLPLLDEGVIYAILHVRGGGELGQAWHKAGMGKHKTNSINDFIDATHALHQAGFGNTQKTYATGESAGGWLVANACIQAPTLYQGCVLHVPFVDLLGQLSQVSDHNDWAEWGHPNHAHLPKISPYEIITPNHYPKMLVIANPNDSRTPAIYALKFVAKLRDNQLARTPIALYTHPQGGHSGADGQQSRLNNQLLGWGFLFGNQEN